MSYLLLILFIQHFPRIEIGLPCGFGIRTNLCGNKIVEEPGFCYTANKGSKCIGICSKGNCLTDRILETLAMLNDPECNKNRSLARLVELIYKFTDAKVG